MYGKCSGPVKGFEHGRTINKRSHPAHRMSPRSNDFLHCILPAPFPDGYAISHLIVHTGPMTIPFPSRPGSEHDDDGTAWPGSLRDEDGSSRGSFSCLHQWTCHRRTRVFPSRPMPLTGRAAGRKAKSQQQQLGAGSCVGPCCAKPAFGSGDKSHRVFAACSPSHYRQSGWPGWLLVRPGRVDTRLIWQGWRHWKVFSAIDRQTIASALEAERSTARIRTSPAVVNGWITDRGGGGECACRAATHHFQLTPSCF